MARGRYGEEGGAPVPMDRWTTEVPFDSADYLDGAPPVYEGDATASSVAAAAAAGLRAASPSRLRWKHWEAEHGRTRHKTQEGDMSDVQGAVAEVVQEGLRDAAASRARWKAWEQRHGLSVPRGHVPLESSGRKDAFGHHDVYHPHGNADLRVGQKVVLPDGSRGRTGYSRSTGFLTGDLNRGAQKGERVVISSAPSAPPDLYGPRRHDTSGGLPMRPAPSDMTTAERKLADEMDFRIADNNLGGGDVMHVGGAGHRVRVAAKGNRMVSRSDPDQGTLDKLEALDSAGNVTHTGDAYSIAQHLMRKPPRTFGHRTVESEDGGMATGVELAVEESLRDAAASRARWKAWEQRHGLSVPRGHTPLESSGRKDVHGTHDVYHVPGDAPLGPGQKIILPDGSRGRAGYSKTSGFFVGDLNRGAKRGKRVVIAPSPGAPPPLSDRAMADVVRATAERRSRSRRKTQEADGGMALGVELAVEESLRDTAASRARWAKWERLHGHAVTATLEPHANKLDGVVTKVDASGVSFRDQLGKDRHVEHGKIRGIRKASGAHADRIKAGAGVKPDVAKMPAHQQAFLRGVDANLARDKAAAGGGAPKPGSKVVINNGGTYEGKAVEVVRVEKDGSLIVKHPKGGSNMLRLKPGRTVNGNVIEPQFRLQEGEMDDVTEAVLAVLEGRSDCEGCGRAEVREAADSMAKASSPEPLGTKPLWHTPGLHLPAYIQHIAHDLMEKRGKTKSNAIQMAIGIVRRWCRGGGKVDANTKAAACKASAEFEAARGAAHAVKEAVELELLEAAVPDDDDPELIAEAERYEADAELRAVLLQEADTSKDDAPDKADGLKVKCPKCGTRAMPKDGKCANCGNDVSKLIAFAKRLKGKSKTQEAGERSPMEEQLATAMGDVL